MTGDPERPGGPEVLALACRLTTKDQRRSELVRGLLDILEATRSEDGTLLYSIAESSEDDVTVFVHEIYRDAEALEAHRASPAHGRLSGKLDDLLAVPPDLSFARLIGVEVAIGST